MPALEEYVYAMEALEEPSLSGNALAALDWAVSGTATCGVTTAGDGLLLPLPQTAASGDFRPAGSCTLPGLTVEAATGGWHPAWGAPQLPIPSCLGQASFPLAVSLAVPALFGLARSGAGAVVAWSAASLAAASGALAAADLGAMLGLAASGLNRIGEAVGGLPALAALAYACGLSSPVATGVGSQAVVGLLCQGDSELAQAAAAYRGGAVGDDAVAAALLEAVATATAYVSDGPDGEDVWTCALGTSSRGYGDCEDGAILLHALLLAAGVPADRLITAFGRVGLDREGHAWVAYRRRCDGRWTALDWTFGSSQGPVSGLPVLGESGFYAAVDYALTAGSFFTVRQDAADFFATVLAEGVALPAPTLEAEASLGGLVSLTLPAGWLACQGGCAAFGQCRLGRAGAVATAVSVRGLATFPPPTGQGDSGAVASVSPGGLGLSGLAGGGGLANLRLGRPQCAGGGAIAALVAGMLALARARGVGGGWVGNVGGASCSIPCPRPRLGGQVGGLAPGDAALPLLGCLGQGGEPIAVAARDALFPLGACGLARPGASALETWAFGLAQGGEWL